MPPKRYRAGVDPTKAAEEDEEQSFINKRKKGEALPANIKVPSVRRVVQPQIISDNSSRAFGGQEAVADTRVRKSVESQVLGSKAEEDRDSTSGSDDESSSDDSSDDSGSSNGDEEDEPVQITFVPKAMREDVAAKEEEEARRKLENQSKENKARQKRSREIASEAVARTEAEENGVATDDEADYPDDKDESGNEEDVKAWKERELARLARDDKD